ncbi:MAG: flippase-like domain-containing protein, partial [Pseudolabrys sp.]|nr:flippase-like domain-containing protein [Pseudolabrys sp.]
MTQPLSSQKLTAFLFRGRNLIRALVSVALIAGVVYLLLSRSEFSSVQAFSDALRPSVVLPIVVFAVVATALSVWRLKLIAEDLGYRLPKRDAIAALSLGLLAGTVFFQMIGQLLARGSLLSRRGVPVAATVTLTIYERAAAAGVSLLLAIAGGWYVFGRITLDFEHGGLFFLKIVAGLTLGLLAGGWLAWGPKALAVAPKKLNFELWLPIGRNVLISALIQFTTMAAYVTAAHALAPKVPILDLAAASAVVMLAAALPISLAGWGVRELSAILALGVVGVPNNAAFVVAVLIGAVSLVVVGVFAVSSLWSTSRTPVHITRGKTGPVLDYGKILAWVVPI